MNILEALGELKAGHSVKRPHWPANVYAQLTNAGAVEADTDLLIGLYRAGTRMQIWCATNNDLFATDWEVAAT